MASAFNQQWTEGFKENIKKKEEEKRREDQLKEWKDQLDKLGKEINQ